MLAREKASDRENAVSKKIQKEKRMRTRYRGRDKGR